MALIIGQEMKLSRKNAIVKKFVLNKPTTLNNTCSLICSWVVGARFADGNFFENAGVQRRVPAEMVHQFLAPTLRDSSSANLTFQP